MTLAADSPQAAITDERRLREELAAVFRLLAHFRMTDLIYTHVSLRVPGPEHHFLINPYGLMFEEITASRLVKIDLDGNAVEPSPYPVNPAGFVIHSAVHSGRDDALCVVHTHTRAGTAVAAQEQGLLPVNQISLQFYDQVAYHEYEGIAFNDAERARLVADLGGKPVMIMRNHGLLTVGETAGQAFLRMFYLDKACEIQINAQAGGAALHLPSPEVSAYTAMQFKGEAEADYGDDSGDDLAWAALLRLLDRVAPDYRD